MNLKEIFLDNSSYYSGKEQNLMTQEQFRKSAIEIMLYFVDEDIIDINFYIKEALNDDF